MAEKPEPRWHDPGVPTTRVEVVQVQSTQDHTSLLFGSLAPAGADAKPRASLERRIILPPGIAKQLATALAEAVRAVEQGVNATPSGITQSAAGEDAVPAAAQPLFRLVQALGVGFGFEKSFKLSPAGLQDDRIILGVRTGAVAAQALTGICREIGMPPDYLEHFARALPEANTAGFGYEGDERGGSYKVYLEFWDRLKLRLQVEPENNAPSALFVGFKWQARDPARRALARYTCHPRLAVSALRGRLEALYAAPDAPSLAAARDLLALAARRVGNDTFVYVEAAEEGNPRNSFDLNLYKARLQVSAIAPILLEVCERYAIPESRFQALSEEIGSRPFGHLSGGIGRDGQDFLTVYYEIEGI